MKVSACIYQFSHVKLFELVSRDEESALVKNKEVMLEHGLDDVEKLYTDFKNLNGPLS